MDEELKYWTNYEVQNFDGSWTSIAALIASYSREARINEIERFKNLATLRLFKDVGPEYQISAKHVAFRLQELKTLKEAKQNLSEEDDEM
jgi:hypothetical protein